MVEMMDEPTATHAEDAAQDTASSAFTLAGTACDTHVVPPFVVAMIPAELTVVDCPTATQSRTDVHAIELS
jgi:hypothetical protein